MVDAGQVNLGRVFGGGDIHAVGIEDIQAGIKRYGFARTSGAGDQHHAVGAVDGLQNQLFLEVFKAQLVNVQRGGIGIQNPHHDFFAKQRGQGADAKVNGLNAFLEYQLDTPVLRNALFGNIQLGHHLDARSQLAADVQRRAHHFAQLAIDTKAHPRTFFVKFKMDVGSTGSQCIRQNFVDKASYRPVFGIVVAHGNGFTFAAGADFAADFVQDGRRLLGNAFQDVIQLVVTHHHQVYGEVEAGGQLLIGLNLGGIGYRQKQPPPALENRDAAVCLDLTVV